MRPRQLAAVVDLRLDVPSGAPTCVGDLLVGQPVDVAQQQRLDELRVLALQRLHRLEQVEAGAGDDAGGARVGPLASAATSCGSAAIAWFFIRRYVDRARVDRDHVQPGGEPAAAGPRCRSCWRC